MMPLYALKQRQGLPLEVKIIMSNARIRNWHNHWNGNVYVAFSGGKDSTVLLDMVRKLYPSVLAVFVNTGLEYPEVIKFVRTISNVIWLKPKMRFKEVISKYGYPIISKEVSQKISEAKTTKSAKLYHKRLFGEGSYKSGKIPKKWQYLINADFKISHKCCDVIKKSPSRRFEKETGLMPIMGTMAGDSHLRRQKYLRNGCATFTGKIESNPLSFWLENDVWDYIKTNKLDYSEIYDKGYKNTGCTWCCFGVHLDKYNKFQLMETTHPKMWDYCINKLGIGRILKLIKVDYNK
jgi:3'-phosphoadenosine 5'-phosphosulfate sulfotransferase (PAPS reductase)/FAD synthetase